MKFIICQTVCVTLYYTSVVCILLHNKIVLEITVDTSVHQIDPESISRLFVVFTSWNN